MRLARKSGGWWGLVIACGLQGSALAAAEPCHECHDVPAEALQQTVHGFLECVDCHAGAAAVPHESPEAQARCETCHDEVTAAFARGVHGRARASGVVEAPGCADCHGSIHALLPSSDPRSATHARRIGATCGRCHSDPALAEKFGILVARPLEAYAASVHARALEEGKPGATCSDCHDSHEILPPSDPESSIFRLRVPETCGGCHREVSEAYRQSVHGRAAARGLREAPVCTDCHGEHRILSPRDPASPVYATNIPKRTCERCHADVRLAEKYDIPADRVPAYEESYHGLAVETGVVTAANCASCHGIHDILPSSDPRSHVHPDNLAATCGRCHPGAGQRFELGPVHVLQEASAHPLVRGARMIYRVLIVFVIGAMILHNGLDLLRKLLRRPSVPATVRAAGRMSPGFRLAHAGIALSFVALAYSGFALTYPEQWWTRPLTRWGGTTDMRGLVHRVAAVALLISLLGHALHAVSSRRARRCIARMRPGREDLRELRERIAYWLGRRASLPRTPVVGYPEKIEYIALWWGSAIMAATGFVLWFETAALRWFPKWITDLATVVHFYEAVLASLAIVVWHFYFVIFDPLVYPMDPAWLTGRSAPGRAHERRQAEPGVEAR